MTAALSFELTNHLPELDVLARKVEEFSTAAALGETEQFHLNLMLDELVIDCSEAALTAAVLALSSCPT